MITLEKIDKKLNRIEKKLDQLLKQSATDQWTSEEDFMKLTGFAKATLRKKRKDGIVVGGKIPGRKGIWYKENSIHIFNNHI